MIFLVCKECVSSRQCHPVFRNHVVSCAAENMPGWNTSARQASSLFVQSAPQGVQRDLPPLLTKPTSSGRLDVSADVSRLELSQKAISQMKNRCIFLQKIWLPRPQLHRKEVLVLLGAAVLNA